MKIEFTGAIPSLQSSIQVNGTEGECTRIKLDCYEVELDRLTKLRGKAFKVTLEEE